MSAPREILMPNLGPMHADFVLTPARGEGRLLAR